MRETMTDLDDWPLRIRLESIKTNLEQVRSARQLVGGRRTEILGLEGVLDVQDGILNAAANLKDELDMALRTATRIRDGKQLADRTLHAHHERLVAAIDEVALIQRRAATTAAIVQTMSTRWSAMQQESFDRHVDQIFQSRAGDLISEIDKAQTRSAADAWVDYRTKIRDASDALFAEYVEFLGGLALRDTGLGGLWPTSEPHEAEYNRDVCQMADDLIQRIYGIGGGDLWHSMVVPGRRDAAARTDTRVIRLGFPDWTVWAVPLAAFEFGQVVVDVNRLVDDFPPDPGPGLTTDELKVALADAFATYVMGPSYAMASIFTRLEPVPAPVGDVSDETDAGRARLTHAERIEVVFRTLRFMDTDDAYATVVDDLRERWSRSLEHNGVQPPPESPRVAVWTDYMCEFLARNASLIKYEAGRWRSVITDWPALSQLASEGRLEPEEDVRDVLNAAWFQRIQEDPPKWREIAICAITLWRADLDGMPKSPRPTYRQVQAGPR
jgi:hypothetical protein